MDEPKFRYNPESEKFERIQNPFLKTIIHSRLSHIKEIIEGPKDPRPGGIPKSEPVNYDAQYLTIYIVSKPPGCVEKIIWGDPNESHL